MQISVLLIDNNTSRRSLLNRTLEEYGYHVAETLKDCQQMLILIDEIKPDIIILGVDSPDQNTLKTLSDVHREMPHPVVMFAENDTPHIIEQTVKAGVSAFIVDDIQPHRVPSIINIAIARFKEQQHIIKELNETKTKLADRKILEKAKGILMSEKGYSEEEAYQCLRKTAMDKGKSIIQVAANIVEVFALLKQALP